MRKIPLDAYQPAELIQLTDSLKALHLAAHPKGAAPSFEARITGSHQSAGNGESLEPATHKYRRELDRTRKQIGRLADEIMTYVLSGRPAKKNKKRCDSCGTFLGHGQRAS